MPALLRCSVSVCGARVVLICSVTEAKNNCRSSEHSSPPLLCAAECLFFGFNGARNRFHARNVVTASSRFRVLVKAELAQTTRMLKRVFVRPF